MNESPDYQPPRRKPKIVSWLSALAGVALLNFAADSFANGTGANGWLLLVVALALLAFALWWARGSGPA